MRWIYISPHLDDAVFSAGGLIYEQVRRGLAVEIWTLFCGFPTNDEVSELARNLQSGWGFHSAEETVRLRRAEDTQAVQLLGADALHFDFLDCVYRRDRDGRWLYDDTFISPRSGDDDLIEQLKIALTQKLKSDDIVVCPLALGGHVDHVIARKAVEGLNRPIRYFADIPYLISDTSKLHQVTNSFQPEARVISFLGLIKWYKSAATYRSQISMEFDNIVNMGKVLTRYWMNGFHLWSR